MWVRKYLLEGFIQKSDGKVIIPLNELFAIPLKMQSSRWSALIKSKDV